MKKQSLTFTFALLAILAFAQPKSFEVSVTGQGQPVIFLPGFTCPGAIWEETAKQLGPGYESHQFTYAGFGGVTPIEMPWYQTLSSEISHYMKKNDIKDAILIGHSMGGMLAIDLAANLPGQVDKVVLVDALPCIREVMMPNVSSDQLFYESPYNKQVLAMSDSAFWQMASSMAQAMSANHERHELLTQWILKADKETYVYGYTDLLKLDLRNKLPLIKAPTLVLAAGFPSAELVSNTINGQFETLKNKDIKIAEGSRHFIMYDKPEWFYSNLKSFLN